MNKVLEETISCEGFRYHLIYGQHSYGYYLVIPEWNIGCEMSDCNDTFWNTESLRKTGLTERTVHKIVNTLKENGEYIYEQKKKEDRLS